MIAPKISLRTGSRATSWAKAQPPVAKVVQKRKMGTATNSPRHDPRNKALNLKRIGWLYPILRDVYFHHELLQEIGTGLGLSIIDNPGHTL